MPRREGRRFVCTVEPDEGRRVAQLRALTDQLVTLVDGVGTDLPDEQAALGRAAVRHEADLSALGGRVARLAIAQRASASPGVLVTLDDGAPRWLPPAFAWTFQPLLVDVLVRLHGDELAVDAREAGRRPILPRSTWVHPLAWWEDADERPLDEAGARTTVGEAYAGVVHPAVAAWVAAGERVVDLGGGRGGLAARLVDAGARVTVVEAHPRLAEAARERLGEAAVVEADVRGDGGLGAVGDVDVVVASGLLEANVMTQEEALDVLARAAARLSPGGRIVVAGIGASLVGADDLARVGLEVSNRSIPVERPGEPVRTCLVGWRRPA